MNNKRHLQLLAYASVCFDRCTNPFETIHLRKNDVTAKECRWLSQQICEIIEEVLEISYGTEKMEKARDKAQLKFAETQEELSP